MVPSRDILGHMSEPDRSVLIRRALREKHLRFLLDQQRTKKQALRSPGGKGDEKPLKCGDVTAPVAFSAVQQIAPPGADMGHISPSTPNAASAQNHQEPDQRPAASQHISRAVQAADALALRRLLDCRELTQEEYVMRLDETANQVQPSLPNSRLPSAREILQGRGRRRQANNGSENTIYSFNDDLTWIKGKHTFKAGGMYQRKPLQRLRPAVHRRLHNLHIQGDWIPR
jgi:hypothetical protein